MRSAKGFTLMEMVVVLALILIVAAITIPSLVESKMNANETSAAGCLRAINMAEVSYQATFGGYADSLANLGGAEPCTKSAATACLLDDSLTAGVKGGYKFEAIGGDPSSGENTTYIATAVPEVFNHTGKRDPKTASPQSSMGIIWNRFTNASVGRMNGTNTYEQLLIG